ncbi:MAG TPA: hypothetical protein VFI96_02970 [Longimicrobiaceae bacterium]|nr:hypothetical protein [Longimicrobiaceae bacterium]
MLTNTTPRQRWHATGANDFELPQKITLGSDTGHAPGAIPLRRDPGACRACGRPLEGAELVRRSWRKLRSGEWAGGRGEFRLYRCRCGALRRVLWSVDMPRPGAKRGGAE